jgi:hypothetical protein
VNEKEFRCCNCATKFEIEKVQEWVTNIKKC